jgi:ParB/RepB/Spo0J family partition protein
MSLSPAQRAFDEKWEFISELEAGKDGTQKLFVVIDPEDLLIVPCDVRAAPGVITDHIKGSITKNGVMTPVVGCKVRSRTDPKVERYALIAGRRRLNTALSLKEKEITVSVRPIETWKDAFQLAFDENQTQLPMSAWDYVVWFKSLMEDNGYTHQEIMETSRLSGPAVTKFLQVKDLPEQIQRYVETGQLDTSKTRELARLKDPSGASVAEAQIKIAEQAVEHEWSSERIRHAVENEKARLEAKAKKDKVKARAKKRNGDEEGEAEEVETKEEPEYKFERASIALLRKPLAHLTLEYHYKKLLRMRRNDAGIEKIKFQEGVIEGFKIMCSLKPPPKTLVDDEE